MHRTSGTPYHLFIASPIKTLAQEFCVKPWLKAGIIGGMVAVFFTLISRIAYFLPQETSALVGRFTPIPFLIIYIATGWLAASWIPGLPTLRQAGLAGILAGLALGIVDETVSMLADLFFLLSGTAGQYFQFPPSPNRTIQMGVYILFLVVWRVGWLTIAIILGGVGGWIYAMRAKLKSAR